MSLPVEEDVRHDEVAPVRPRIGRHAVDPVSLVAGLLAVVLALLALLDVDVEAAVVLPSLLLLVGAIGLVSALRRTRS